MKENRSWSEDQMDKMEIHENAGPEINSYTFMENV